jgi:glutathione synthase
MKLNWLILTDHTTHRESNSLYALTDAIRRDSRCGKVWICTRGVVQNAEFFSGRSPANIYASSLDQPFTFAGANEILQTGISKLDPTSVDVVLIRMPQPIQRAFMFSLPTHFPNARFVNDPIGIYETASKKFLLDIAHLCPPVQLVESTSDAIALSRNTEVVLKPLYSYGGIGMFRLSEEFVWREDEKHRIDDLNDVIKELDFPMLAMQFLPRVTEGDKRTIVVNKRIIGSALRTPGPGSWMCNISHGGTACMSEPDQEELRIEAVLTPLLHDKGIVMYGFDTLVNDDGHRVLSEINTLSVGGLMPMEKMSRKPVMAEIAGLLHEYVTTTR